MVPTAPRTGVLLARDVLVADEEDLVLEERAVELGELVVGDRGEVHTGNVRARGRADWLYTDVSILGGRRVFRHAVQHERPGAMAEHSGVACHRAEL